MTEKVFRLLDSIDLTELDRLMQAGNYLETWKFIESEIFALK